jgi:hypothetical protein
VSPTPTGKQHSHLGYPPADVRLDWTAALLGFAFMSGLLVDGWSHAHTVTDSFFTPSHAVLYGAFTFLAATYVAMATRNRVRGYPIARSLPQGYALSLFGVGWFVLGIPADMTWHIAIGPEKNLGILLSPTHLYLAVGMALMLTGPLRAGLAQQPPPKLLAQLPLLISAAAFFMLLQFFTQYAFAFDAGFDKSMAPFGYQAISTSGNLAQMTTVFYRQIEGLFAVIVHAVLLAGIVVVLARSLRLAPGSFTVLFVLAIATVSAMIANDTTTYAIDALLALLTGVLADALYAVLKPYGSAGRLRAFCTIVPGAHYALFFVLQAALAGGTWFDPNLMVGSIVLPAVIGLLLAVLATLPAPSTAAT